MTIEATWQRIVAQKRAARRELRNLPWTEKFRRLDAMRERQEALRHMKREDEIAALPRYARQSGTTTPDTMSTPNRHRPGEPDEKPCDPRRCARCDQGLQPGIALRSTVIISPDDLGGNCTTMNFGGPGEIISVLKCPGCGHSIQPAVRFVPPTA